MNIRRLSVEVTPPTFLDSKTFSECRVEVIVNDQKFAFVEVISHNDFIPYFERLMDYARSSIISAVKEHEDGTKSPKGRRSRKSS